MPKDQMHALTDAEATIEARKKTRDGTTLEHRGTLATELIADELTRLNAEVRTLRYLIATAAVQPRK